MKILNKVKSLVFFICLFTFFNAFAVAQKTDENCFEVKYLDFFGLAENNKISWSEEEINKLLEMDYSKNFDNTRFYIPLTVHFLKDFHPNCNKSVDTERFNKLVSLYFKIRQKDVSVVKNKAIGEKLDFIREDFYNLVQDERFLFRMRYRMDDGPLYGEIPKAVPKTKPLETVAADFGKLTILESNNRIFLVATDKKNQTIWSRIMKGTNPERHLRNLNFDKTPIEKTSLATIIHLYSEGEKLNLYLKPDGKFMCYFHSW